MEQEFDERTKKILDIKKTLLERDQARLDSNFAKSDLLRNKLVEKYNIEIFDQKSGPSGFKFKDGTSNKLPPGIKLPKDFPLKKANNTQDVSNKKKRKRDSNEKLEDNTKINKKNKEQDRNKSLLSNIMSLAEKNIGGVKIEDIKIGEGKQVKSGDKIKVNYVGKLKSTNKVFDASKNRPFSFRLGRGEVIQGWEIGCLGMRVGGKRKLTIPPEKAYGKSGAPPVIPPNAWLIFEVTLVSA